MQALSLCRYHRYKLIPIKISNQMIRTCPYVEQACLGTPGSARAGALLPVCMLSRTDITTTDITAWLCE